MAKKNQRENPERGAGRAKGVSLITSSASNERDKLGSKKSPSDLAIGKSC